MICRPPQIKYTPAFPMGDDMKLMSVLRYLVVVLLIVPGIGLGQNKVPVYVNDTVAADDQIGRQLVFEIREAIRGSQGYRLVEDSRQFPYIKYFVSTVRTAAGGTAAAYTIVYDSVSMQLSGALISGGVQICPRERVSSCARSALASIDEAWRQLQREAPDLWKTLNKER